MRIAIILNRWPYPAIAGRERVLLQHIGQLQAAGEIVLFCPESPTPKPDWLADVSVISIPRSSIPRALIRATLHGLPLQEAYYSSPLGASRVAAEHARKPFDVVFVDMIRMAGTVAQLPAAVEGGPRLVIDFDDRLSRRYEQMLMLDSPSLLGGRSKDFPPIIQRAAKLVGRMVLRTEAARMRHRELYWGRNCDFSLFSASSEAREFADELETVACGSTLLLPVESAPELQLGTELPRLVFIGNIKHSQGIETFRLILNAMEDRLSSSYDVPILHVFGVHGEITLPEVLKTKVVLHGFVDSLSSVARLPSILLAPITFGTGIKTKVFDALAAGIVVVTTPRGAEGMDVVPGRELCVVERADQVVNAAITLTQDKAAFLRMREEGLAFIARSHNPERAADIYRRILGR